MASVERTRVLPRQRREFTAAAVFVVMLMGFIGADAQLNMGGMGGGFGRGSMGGGGLAGASQGLGAAE